jgi:glycosyltransferase involved in cell wall biosynthesis
MKRCLLFTEYFLPSHQGGGAVQTSKNLIERLGDKYEFCVLTGDRESPSARAYEDVPFNQWIEVIGARTHYAPLTAGYLLSLRRLIKEAGPDLVYLNSFFAPRMALFMLLRRFGVIPKIPVIVAPEDELSEGAMNSKRRKKVLFIFIVKLLGIYKHVLWKASSPREKKEIESFFGQAARIHIAPSATPRMLLENFSLDMKPKKESGKAVFSFISRITAKKNLHFALEAMEGLKGQVRYDIYGPIEDNAYWREKCEAVIKRLPSNIEVVHQGTVPHAEVARKLSASHFFALSTLSESFGHVVLEALAGGCPLVLSDRTPWLDLEEKGLGWDIPLEQTGRWREILQRCVDMDASEYEPMVRRARQHAVEKLDSPEIIEANYELFEKALELGR